MYNENILNRWQVPVIDGIKVCWVNGFVEKFFVKLDHIYEYLIG